MAHSINPRFARDTRKFYRTIIEIEVLSDEPFEYGDLSDIEYAITQGHTSGTYHTKTVEQIGAVKIAQLLTAQGSDPNFLLGYDDSDLDLDAH